MKLPSACRSLLSGGKDFQIEHGKLYASDGVKVSWASLFKDEQGGSVSAAGKTAVHGDHLLAYTPDGVTITNLYA